MAIEALCQLERTRLPATGLFDTVTAASLLGETDRHLAMNIFYGVLRQRQTLEYLLQELCRQPLSRLKPFIKQALLTGLYQIFFLDRIPESAAVNESVKAVKNARLPQHLQGFVNAVLRESLRQKNDLQTKINQLQTETPCLNHPLWLITRWQKKFGDEETRRICEKNNRQPPLVLQINSSITSPEQMQEALTRQGIIATPGAYGTETLILPDYHGAVSKLPGFEQGCFQIQDEAAGLLVRLFNPLQKGGYYLDACAGLGGKTSNLIQLGAGLDLTIIAVEPELQRQNKFYQNLQRLHPAVKVSLHTMTLAQFAEKTDLRFDGILIDAPCSGTGVIARHPDIRWNRREEDLPRYQHKQLMLLRQAAKLLKENGILVYATCSLETEENERVIARFLEQHPDFFLEECSPCLPQSARPLLQGPYFAPHPGLTNDGFFGARLRRNPANTPQKASTAISGRADQTSLE